MATFGDVVNLFFETLGKGAQHQYATETRGPDYRLKEQAATGVERRGAISEAQLFEKIAQERELRGVQGARAREAGFGGSDLAAAESQRLALEDQKRKLEQRVGESQLATEAAQQGELRQRHVPKPAQPKVLTPEEIRLIESRIGASDAAASLSRARLGQVGKPPVQGATDPSLLATRMSELQDEAEEAGVTLDEYIQTLGIVDPRQGAGTPTPVPTPAPAPAAAAVATRDQITQLPVGATFTDERGRKCTKTSATSKRCE